MDTAQWPQDTIMKPMEEMSKTCSIKTTALERKAITRPQKEQAAVNCPRCNSTNTKFCYYNNYSLTQPRYFCKTCRRYWTEGGTLRNIPVGGGSRKNKRSVGGGGGGNSSSSPSTSTTSSAVLLSSKKIINLDLNPKIHEAQDLNLGFSTNNSIITQDFKTISELIQVPNFERKESCSQQLSALEMITGISSRGGGGGGGFKQSFFPMQNTSISTDPAAAAHEVYSNGFSQMLLPDFKQSLSFSLEGFGNGGYIGNLQSVQETNGRFLFPFEDLKQVSGTTSTDNNIDQEINRDQNAAPDSNGYWNGVIGGGSW